MAKPEEIDDTDADKKINSEEEEDTEDEDAEDEEESDSEDDDEEDDESEDDDDDESDSDDDDKKPLTRGDLMKILSQRGKNRTAAAARASGKRDLSGSRRSPKGEERIASVEQSVQRIEQLETKRAFGYENNLSPDEVDVVFKIVGKKPRSKDLLDPVVKGALDGYRTAKRAKNNTPSSTGRPARVSSKEERAMTPSDRKDRFQDRRRQILAGKNK